MKKFLMPKFHFHIERWKYNMGLNCYISNFGNIRTADGKPATVGKQNGYLFYRGKPVHRLVMETWKPIPDYSVLTVDHLNHNTFENTIWNLEWVTKEENQNREQKDREHFPENNIPPIDTPICVKVNGILMSLKQAEETMKTDASLSVDKIKNLLDKITITKQKKYGNFEVILYEPEAEELKPATKEEIVNIKITTPKGEIVTEDKEFLVNTVKMTVKEAIELFKKDKAVPADANFIKAFERAIADPSKSHSFCRYKIQYIKEKEKTQTEKFNEARAKVQLINGVWQTTDGKTFIASEINKAVQHQIQLGEG